MNSNQTIIVINIPPGINALNGNSLGIYLFVKNKRAYSKKESEMLSELQHDEYMGRFLYDAVNFDCVSITINDSTDNVLGRALQCAETYGMIFDGECGQFKLSTQQFRADYRATIMKIIGAASYEVRLGKYGKIMNAPAIAN